VGCCPRWTARSHWLERLAIPARNGGGGGRLLVEQAVLGAGIRDEGARAALQFGFKTLGLKQIIGLTHPENKASQNVLLKCGLEYVEQKEYFGMRVYRYQIIK